MENLKEKALEMRRQGKSLREIGGLLGYSHTAVYNWLNGRHGGGSPLALEKKTVSLTFEVLGLGAEGTVDMERFNRLS